MLRVWGRRSAFNVQKVLWLIGELGLPHEHIAAGGAYGGLDDPRFRAMNPHGRVPVVDDGGTVVWESHAILRYLAACHGAGTLWPVDPRERSFADRWMDWAQVTLQPDFMGLFWGYFRTPESARDWPAIRAFVVRCEQHYRLLDRHLAASEHLAGERFTIGDIPAGASLFRYFALDIERPELPHLRAWYERLRARSAYREHVMLPFEELRGRTEY